MNIAWDLNQQEHYDKQSCKPWETKATQLLVPSTKCELEKPRSLFPAPRSQGIALHQGHMLWVQWLLFNQQSALHDG